VKEKFHNLGLTKMKEKIVYAYVVADLLHVGHILALENAKEFAGKEGKLIVGILTDDAVMEKKPKPLTPFNERMKLIQSLKCVDIVVAQKNYSPIPNVKRIKPDILMESDSHSIEDLKETINTLELIGCKVQIMPYFPEQSSSNIKNGLINKQNDIEKNNLENKNLMNQSQWK